MAELLNDTGALRLTFTLAGRAGGEGREVLASAALDAFEARSGEFWPVVQLPLLRLASSAVWALVDGLRDLARGAVPGLAWRDGEAPALGLQLGAEPGGATAELGLDLGRFLAASAGAPHRPGAELALFRFRVGQAGLVSFGSALAEELRDLGLPGGGAA